MINTPICDFVARYAGEKSIRLHMPGHKGTAFIGPEAFDITEPCIQQKDPRFASVQ